MAILPMKIPQFLYHGTSASKLQSILENGLQPRRENESNWVEFPSHPEAVYLTSAYAFYYAQQASESSNSDLLILRINTSLLDKSKFRADEDFVEQATRGKDNIGLETLEERTQYYRENLEYFDAESSLKHLGNCTYFGDIPIHCIDKILLFKKEGSAKMVMRYFDPIITLMNFAFCGEQHKTNTDSLFDEESAKEKFLDLFEYFEYLETQQTGKTTYQMLSSKKGSVYVWCNAHLGYPKRMKMKLGRDDLVVVSPDWLVDGWRGIKLKGLTIDHSCSLTPSQRIGMLAATQRICEDDKSEN